MLACVAGAVCFLAGACIVFKIKIETVSLSGKVARHIDKI